MLDYPIEEVHEEAERLEHFISERLEERIAAKLGHPKIDPHGHCIPTLDGTMPNRHSIPLTENLGQGVFIVESISDNDVALVKTLRTAGIAPGVRLRVRSSRAADVYTVSVGRSAKVTQLSRAAADMVRIVCER
jgi:DtxR family Mn-dependent transcriptional regulator